MFNNSNHKFLGIVPAGGIGSRMNASKPKQFLEVSGKPILIITLETLIKTGIFTTIIIPTIDQEYCQSIIKKHLPEHQKLMKICPAGNSRQESVFKALQEAEKLNLLSDYTLVHDAVRALIDAKTIEKVCAKALETGAAIAARPLSDTLKTERAQNIIEKTIPRDKLWTVQTPQVFKTSIMFEAFNKAETEGFIGTDCSSLVERLGYEVHLVESPITNIKITTPEDLELAETLIMLRQRILPCHSEPSKRA